MPAVWPLSGSTPQAGLTLATSGDDDVVNCGGELVHPGEVEEVLLGEAAVAEAAVAGCPHQVLGAVPVAWIQSVHVLDAGQADQLVSQLRLRCEQQLSRVKRPVEYRIVAGLPRTATGKVLRRQLREDAAQCGVSSL